MNVKIGEFIKFARLKKKMTIKDLSKECKLSQGYISQIERGEATPSIVSLNKLSKSLNINIWELFKDNDHHRVQTRKERLSSAHLFRPMPFRAVRIPSEENSGRNGTFRGARVLPDLK